MAIAKETGRRLGMGTNMYPSSSLLGREKEENHEALPVDELIEKADGFAGVFPGNPKNFLRKKSFQLLFKYVACISMYFFNIYAFSVIC